MSKNSEFLDLDFFKIIAHEAITNIMAFSASDGHCVYVNRSAKEALEIPFTSENSAGELAIMYSDLFPFESSSDFLSFSNELMATEGFHINTLMRRANGSTIVVNLSVKHVHREGLESLYLIMFEDLTVQMKLQRAVDTKQDEIKMAFNEILDQNKQLLELDGAKDRFIALTTHELRTPLSAIVATSEVLDLKLYESEVQRDEFIKTIHEQGVQLMELVNDILDFAKIRAGKMEFCVEYLDSVPLIKKLVTGYQQMAFQAKVNLEIQVPDLPVFCYVDGMRLKEVFTNVISNAIKYNRENGKVTIKFNLLSEKNMVRITVSDTGHGIAPDKIHHVFNEFETVGHVSRVHKGTGLGMPISKRLMLAMGGDLSLDSVVGEGSSFYIDLPVEKVLGEELYQAREDNWADLAS